MDKRPSPISKLNLREKSPSFSTPEGRLLIFNLRAYEFFSHPYFVERDATAQSVPMDLIFESLAFRLRPLAMTERDDCSIWRTLETLRELDALDETTIVDLERRYSAWLNISDEDLRPYWPTWRLDEPHTTPTNEDLVGPTTPIQELWDRVYGYGPHSDYKRVLRNTLVDYTEEGRANRVPRYRKLVATIAAIEPLVVALHNQVLGLITGEQSALAGLEVRLWRE